MKAIQAVLSCLLLVSAASTAAADPPGGHYHGHSPAKWDVKGLESDLRELDKLAKRGEWQEINFQQLFQSYLVSARRRLETIRHEDPSLSVQEYERDLERWQRTYDQHTRQRPPPPPPPHRSTERERAVIANIAEQSRELVRGRLLLDGPTGYFDDNNKVRAFVDAALRADYRHERADLEHQLSLLPDLRQNQTIARFIAFESQFNQTLDRLILPEIGRLLDTAYSNRARNKPFGITKARAALDLIFAVRLVTDHPRLEALAKQAHLNMNELARGIYPTGFHAENAGRIVFSKAPISIGRESTIDNFNRFSSGHYVYAAAYFDKVLRQTVPPGSAALLDTRIFVDGREMGRATTRLDQSQLGVQVVDVPMVPQREHSRDDRAATITKILSNISPGRHLVRVVVTARGEGGGFNRDVAEGTALVSASAPGLEAWSRIAIELTSGAPPPPPPPFQVGHGNPGIIVGQRPPPPPPRVDHRVARAELPEEKVRDAGVLREATVALERRFHQRPLKAGFFTHWDKGTQNGNKFRKITVWVVWPDTDRDGVAQIESYEMLARWNVSRWNPLEVVGPDPRGPHYQILVSKVR